VLANWCKNNNNNNISQFEAIRNLYSSTMDLPTFKVGDQFESINIARDAIQQFGPIPGTH
jgi:hypothetical protein